MKRYWVYILCSKQNGTLYIGITSDIMRRIGQHKEGLIEGFTKKYGIKKLVYIEEFTNPEEAIVCEKRLKKWKREWKIKLITERNPNWEDLYDNAL